MSVGHWYHNYEPNPFDDWQLERHLPGVWALTPWPLEAGPGRSCPTLAEGHQGSRAAWIMDVAKILTCLKSGMVYLDVPECFGEFWTPTLFSTFRNWLGSWIVSQFFNIQLGMMIPYDCHLAFMFFRLETTKDFGGLCPVSRRPKASLSRSSPLKARCYFFYVGLMGVSTATTRFNMI